LFHPATGGRKVGYKVGMPKVQCWQGEWRLKIEIRIQSLGDWLYASQLAILVDGNIV
jgi:hypothetical protein